MVGGGRVTDAGCPTPKQEARPVDALGPPPRCAKPARKSARCGVGDGSPSPHPPHPQPMGSGPRPHAPKDGRRGVGECPTPDAPRQGKRCPPRGALVPPPQRAKLAHKSGPARGGARPQARQGEEGNRPSPHELNRRSTGPQQEMWRGTNRLERPYRRPAPELRVVRAPDRPGGGGRRERRGSTSAHTRNGHAARTRRATGPSPRNAETAWNGVQAGEGKGYPGRTTRNTHREGREGREEPKGRQKNRHRPQPPRPAARAANTRAGHCTRPVSSNTQCYAPAPRLGSLRASPWGSRWRQASSTGDQASGGRRSG